MTATYQPRYVAYATAHGRTPDAMLEHDRARFPGGKMVGFSVWVNQQWAAFLAEHRDIRRDFMGPAEHARFDAWLARRTQQGTA